MKHIPLIVLFLLFAFPALAQGVGETPAREAYIIDFDTGQILFEKNGGERMPTSSMSKVMTVYMVFEALKEGKITMDTEFPVSEKAWSMGGSKMFVEIGNKIKVQDLLRGVIVQSGNDATIVLAEGLAGTEEAFAAAMTRKAKQLGMENSNFVNASGWPDDNHYSTAEDLAILARAMILNFSDFYKMYSETEFEYHGIKQGNRNPLLYMNVGADGVKTGHTEVAGYGLIASGTKDGRRVVMVVNGLESEKQRREESARLFTWALDGFENYKVFTAGQAVENAPVELGKSESVPLVVAQDVLLTIPKLMRDEIKTEAQYSNPLIAPIASGTSVGKMTITLPGQAPLEYELKTGASVEKLGFFARMGVSVKKAFGNLLKKD